MTSGSQPELPGSWPVILAAYADGELDPSTHQAVERWLAAHPELGGDLPAQQQLAPANRALWTAATPPLPGTAAWDQVFAAIESAATPEMPTTHVQERYSRRNRLDGLVASGLVAFLVLVIGLVIASGMFRSRSTPPLPPGNREDEPLPDYAILPIASEDDVDVQRTTGTADDWLPVGVLPLPNRIVLAEVGDIELEEASPSEAWPDGKPEMTHQPGDAPMIFATSSR